MRLISNGQTNLRSLAHGFGPCFAFAFAGNPSPKPLDGPPVVGRWVDQWNHGRWLVQSVSKQATGLMVLSFSPWISVIVTNQSLRVSKSTQPETSYSGTCSGNKFLIQIYEPKDHGSHSGSKLISQPLAVDLWVPPGALLGSSGGHSTYNMGTNQKPSG